MLLADETAHVAKDKVELVSRAIDTTHERVMDTTEFIQRKVIEPARELAAILAGVRRGLEVLVAPAPSPINSHLWRRGDVYRLKRKTSRLQSPNHRLERKMVRAFILESAVRQSSSSDDALVLSTTDASETLQSAADGGALQMLLLFRF